MMKGIRLSHGTVFVTDDFVTVRLLTSGECSASPISFEVLEWNLRTEPPSGWDYLTEGEILSLPNGGGERIVAAIAELRRVFGIKE